VADHRVPRPGLFEQLVGQVVAEERVRVEPQRVHPDPTLGVAVPQRAAAVPVELDTVALGVGEVERQRHEVVRRSDVRRGLALRHGREGGRETGLVVEQDGGMEQARGTADGWWQVRCVLQDHQRRAAATEGDGGGAYLEPFARLLQDVESQRVAVEPQLPVQVPDQERHGVHARAGGDRVVGAWRRSERDGSALSGRGCGRHAHLNG